MAIIKNQYGVEIDFDAAVALMDDDIREDLHFRLAPPAPSRSFSRLTPSGTLKSMARSLNRTRKIRSGKATDCPARWNHNRA